MWLIPKKKKYVCEDTLYLQNSRQGQNCEEKGFENQQVDALVKHFEGLETFHHSCACQDSHPWRRVSCEGTNFSVD